MPAIAHNDDTHDRTERAASVVEPISPELAALPDTPAAEPSTNSGLDTTLFATAENPCPKGAVSGYFDGQDLTRVRFARWEPSTSDKRGTVCLFTGRAEFIEKYYETIGELLARGFHVAIMDWRGQGGSARALGHPLKGHVTTFDQYLADLHLFMGEVVLPDCPGPYFGLAHSMGANILLQALARRVHWFDRAVLCSPMLELAKSHLPLSTLRRIAEFACYAGLAAAFVPGGRGHPRKLERFRDNPLTSDRRRFDRNLQFAQALPHLTLGSPTIGWFHAAARAMEVVTEPEFTPMIRVPLLMVAAGNDQVVSTPVIEAIGRSLRGGGTVIIDGARHEILQERDWLREQFWAAFDAFVPGTRS